MMSANSKDDLDEYAEYINKHTNSLENRLHATADIYNTSSICIHYYLQKRSVLLLSLLQIRAHIYSFLISKVQP